MKKSILVGAAVLAAGTTFAQNWVWTGAVDQNDFTNGGNWTTNGIAAAAAPTSSNATQFDVDSSGSYAVYNNDSVTMTVNAIYVGQSADGRLDVTAGTFQGSGQRGRYKWGIGHTGTVNISGTGMIDSGGGVHLGTSSGTGILTISESGTLSVGRGNNDTDGTSSSLIMGDGSGASGSLTIGDSGTLSLGFGARLGNNGGSAEFSILGGGATINLGTRSADVGTWYQEDTGVLSAYVGEDGLLSTINLQDSSDATELQTITFEAGSVLDLGFMGTEVDGEWTLMQFEDDAVVTDNGLTLSDAAAAAGWTFEFKDTDASGGVDAMVVAIPEPVTLGMVALFGGGLLFIRRRFSI